MGEDSRIIRIGCEKNGKPRCAHRGQIRAYKDGDVSVGADLSAKESTR
jgi:hypothetical protein